ncbi:antibiotic biosynthesis monooxygenase [Amycolatopsis suaedae]|uniref:Antibiotic biosynthesis monooxygenase n=2 Tax=Amycolatopsis suaedae TaxID=2510978 RepID=A0A4Q7JCE0_9PSEU|nr:antibiotic biosynthesis monooxygenase [Amycolatopsis suaedae]
MLIIAGWARVPAERRDEYVAAHQEMVGRARVAEGCHDLAITADPLEDDRVNVYERWESEETLTAWRAVANAPRLDVPIEAGDIAKYTIESVRGPFD